MGPRFAHSARHYQTLPPQPGSADVPALPFEPRLAPTKPKAGGIHLEMGKQGWPTARGPAHGAGRRRSELVHATGDEREGWRMLLTVHATEGAISKCELSSQERCTCRLESAAMEHPMMQWFIDITCTRTCAFMRRSAITSIQRLSHKLRRGSPQRQDERHAGCADL